MIRKESVMHFRSNVLRPMMSLVCFLSVHLSLFAQTFPVQSSLQLVPPYSLKLPDYVAPGSEKLVLNASLIDFSKAQLDVELRVLIEGQGIRIQTNPSFDPPPITLISGINSRLTGLDLEPYFRAENLNFFGIGRQQFGTSGGALPEGIYRICIDVVEANREVPIATRACGTAWLVLNDPPIVNLPRENEKLEPTDPQFVRFQWTPRHTGSPNSAFTTDYDFQLVEVWPTGRNPNDAMLTTTPIYETTTSATSLVYGPSEPALVRGRRYAFRIRARSLDGIEQLDLFRNEGFTQVQSFIYGDECLVPPNVSVEAVSSRKLEVYWDTAPVHSGFLVRYRKQGETDWIEERILFNGHTLEGLQPDTNYEVQVLGICGFSSSPKSGVIRSKTQAEIVGDFSCGSPPESFNLDNRNPLPSLNRGDVIMAGDFDVSMIEVTGSNGTFSGSGQVVVPMMNNVKAGTTFSNIKVNDEYRMYDGSMQFTGVTVQALPDDVLDDINDFFDDVLALEDNIVDLLDVGEQIADSVNRLVEEIQNTDVFTEQEYEEIISEETTVQDLEDEVKEALGEAVDAAKGGNIVEAARQVLKARTINSRLKAKKEQAVHADSVKVVAVTFTAGGKGYDLGPGHDGIALNYYKLITDDGDAYGPWFSIQANQSARITAEWVSSSEVPKDSIAFTLGDQAISATPSADGWELTIPAGKAGEKMVLKAVSGTRTVGIAAIAFYQQENRKVTLVSVNGEEIPTATEAADYLNDVFGSAVVQWEVNVASVTIGDDWDLNGDGSLYLGENNDLSTYPDEAKAFIRLVKNAPGMSIADDRYYMLFTDAVNSSGAAGFMPRKKQFGLVFDGRLHTLAHELGHGAFRLAHTWEDHPNLEEGNTDNLMDYGLGKDLRQYQWDEIHDPKWVISLFDDEEEAGLGGQVWLTPDWKLFQVDGTNTLSVRLASTKIPGTVPGFKKDGIVYYATFEGDSFLGYFSDTDDPTRFQVSEIDPASHGNKPVFLYEHNGGCGSAKYYQTTYAYVKENNHLNVLAGLNGGKLIACTEEQDLDNLCEKGREYYESYEQVLSLSQSEKDFLYKISKLICDTRNKELIAAQMAQYRRWEDSAKTISEILAGNPFSFERYYRALVELEKWRDTGLALFTDVNLKGFTEEEREQLREQIFDVAFQLDTEVIALLPLERKVKMLTVMMDGRLFSFSKNHEALVVKLITSIKDSEASEFLDILTAAEYKNSDGEPFIYQLKENLGDFIGKDYTAFFRQIKRLSDARSRLSDDKLDVKVYLEWDVKQEEYIIISMVKNRNDYTFTYDESDHTVHVSTCVTCCSRGRKSCSARNDYLLPQGSSPFDLVGLTIINDVSPFGAGCKDGSVSLGSNEYCGETQIVPAIFLDYLQEKESSQMLSNFGWNVFNVVITVATFGEGAAAISAIRTASAGTRMYVAAKNAYTLIDFTYTVTDMALKAADVNTPKAWTYVGYAFSAKTSYDLIKNGGAKGIGHLKKLLSKGSTDEALEIVEELGVKVNGEAMTRADLETFVKKSSDKIEASGNPELIDNYKAGLTGKINSKGTTWDEVLGAEISKLEDPPKGYEFYKRGENEWIRRIDANNPDTPRLTVDGDGKIIQYVYSDAHRRLLTKLDELSVEVPSLRRWMEDLTNNSLFSKLTELDKAALNKLESDLAADVTNTLRDAFKEKPDLVNAWRLLDDANVPTALKRDPDKLTKVNRYLDNNPTKKDGFIDDLKNTSNPEKFVDRTSWRDDILQQHGDDINQFQTQGLSRSDLPESLVDDMVDASSAPPSFIDQAINDAINAGSDIPIKKTFSQGDELFKIVPKDGTVSDFTPFWVTKAEWDNVKNLSNMEQKLGLPISSHAVEYDVYKITANQTGNIFESTIAPTVQNGFETIGEATQTLVLDRNLWSTPVKIGTHWP
ncbi:MAG: fibronectin type III domain-containing protein [Bacteroidota bacterium]